jgi:hypothetical protein
MDPAAAASERTRRRVRLARAMALAAIAFTIAVYVWAVSGGTWADWPTYSDDYQRLADAFARGQTYLVERPDASLLALPDPYDPIANRPFALHDASLFDGRYYLYWGPVPALVIAAINAMSHARSVPDQTVVFTASCGTVVFAALLVLRLWRRHFADQPAWTPALGVLLVGLATPTPFNLARPMIYEASIHAAQMFFVAGLYFALLGLDRPADRIRPRSVALLISGTCFACAFGCRASVALAVVAVAACVCWRALRTPTQEPERRRSFVLAAIAFLLPLYAGAFALAGYNFARFGSPLEFGIRYQLAGFNSPKEYPRLVGVRYIGSNLASYLFEPVPESELFPFVRPPAGESPGVADRIRRPPQRIGRGLPAGIIWAVPFALFALMPSMVAFSRRRKFLWADHQPESHSFVPWLALTLGMSVVLLAIPALLLTATSAHLRYQADWTSTLLILSMMGFWLARRRFAEHARARGIATAVALLAAAVTIAAGPMLAVTRTPSHFSVHRSAPYVDPERY